MESSKKGKSVIGIFFAGILCLIGLGEIGALISTGSKSTKAVKIVKGINRIEDTVDLSKTVDRKQENKSPLNTIKQLNDAYSTIDNVKTINDVRELNKKMNEDRFNKPIQPASDVSAD